MLERDLRAAIENGDFELYYQHQVNPKKNVLKGAEALIRWRHKKWGLVSPNEFIPIAEKNHLIDKIDDWVIQNVCKQIAEWKKQGLTLYPISINISPYRFFKPSKRKRAANHDERRKYSRFKFPFHLPAKMYITKVGKKNVSLGHANILVENISLGGMLFLTTLSIPVVSQMKFRFELEMMDEKFVIDGNLVHKNEIKENIFSYGVSFNISDFDEGRLAYVINQMSVLRRLNQEIPNTIFVEEDPYLHLRRKLT